MTRVRNFSNWAYWRLHLETVADIAPPPDVEAWRTRTRVQLDALLGPSPEPVPLDLETTDSVDCGTYQRERIVFDTERTMSVPAFLLVPHARRDASPGPAVLAIHGHGPGKSLVCGIDIGGPGDDYAHQLAMLGYVVLAPDLRGFGERADWMPPDKYHCDWDLVCATMAGVVPLQRNLWDMQRALDVLTAHPLVDAHRVAAAGLSYGATCTLFLAALDDRVRVGGRVRLSVVVARRAHRALEHVRLAGDAGSAGPARAPRRRGARRSSPDARRVRASTTSSSRSRPPRDRRRARARLRAASARA